jgi:DNA primase
MSTDRFQLDSLKCAVRITDVARAQNFEGRRDRYFCPSCQSAGAASHKTPDLASFDHDRRFKCHKCNLGGDIIDFVALLLNTDTKGAIKWLKWHTGISTMSLSHSASQNNAEMTAVTTPPPHEWQQRGLSFVQRAATLLWSAEGQGARQYLNERGLSDLTIKRARLGYIPRATEDDPAKWGLETDRSLYIPANVVLIPRIVSGHLWALKYRKMDAGIGGERYMCVKGSKLSGAMYQEDHLQGQRVLVFTEGEFDALLLQQCAGDLAGIATTGGCSGTISINAKFAIMAADVVLVAYDNDDPGEKGAQSLIETSSKARRLRPISGKDISDMYLSGISLQEFLLEAIADMDYRS